MEDLSSITKWYTGKAKEKIITFVLPTLAQALVDGHWAPKTSRSVKSLLRKQAVAQKFAKANDRDRNGWRARADRGRLIDIFEGPGEYATEVRGYEAVFAMQFGAFERAEKIAELTEKLVKFCANDEERAAVAKARQWAEDFVTVAKLVETLDSMRPKPAYVFAEISPSVFANVGRTLALDFSSVRQPEIRWVRVILRLLDEKEVQMWEPEIIWPEGTRHAVSKFAHGSDAGNAQCEACGHAIKRADNWVPLLLDSASTEGPCSLWVGKDCAKKLFGCTITGTAKFKR